MNTFTTIIILNSYIQKEQLVIFKPISRILGFILNLIFNLIDLVTSNYILGISIIIFTIFTRLLMMPLAFKQQKSMFIMQKMQPEIKKIQEKYKGLKDPESRKNMGIELNKVYTKYDYNYFSGCLPLFIQLPIFIALYYVMQNPYMFINSIGEVYQNLANELINSPNFAEVMVPIATPMVPKNMTIDISVTSDLLKILNKLSLEQWEIIKTSLQGINIDQLLEQKNNIEYFLGINLTERSGFGFPKVIIPILSGLTTFLSTWIMMKKSSANADPMIVNQQKVMSFVMPLFMAYITTSLPVGVGIYWITSNTIQVLQQIYIGKYYEKNSTIIKE